MEDALLLTIIIGLVLSSIFWTTIIFIQKSSSESPMKSAKITKSFIYLSFSVVGVIVLLLRYFHIME